VISLPAHPAIGLGQTCEFMVKATDDDGDPVSLSAAFLPENATFDPATGKFAFTPEAKQLRQALLGQGVIAIFLARDNHGAESTALVDITPVASVDGPMLPTLSVPPGPIVVRVVDKLSFEVASLAQSPACSVSISASVAPQAGALASFSQSSNKFSFAPNASMVNRPFLINFTDTDCASRTRSASVRILVIDAGSNCEARGTGSIDVPNTRVDFGGTRVNDHGGATTVSVTNRGGGPLSIASITLSDELNYRVEGIPSSSLILQPGGVFELSVFFEPKQPGTARATLTIASSDSETPSLEIALKGKASK